MTLFSSSPLPDEKKNQLGATLEVEGIFFPSQRTVIKSPFQGRLEDLAVTRGQMVPSGYPLMSIVEERLFADLDRKHEELEVAEQATVTTRDELLLLSAMEESENSVEGTSETDEQDGVSNEDQEPEPIPTFEQLAQTVNFTSVDAGGIWPEIEGEVIAQAQGPQDAGGVWPSYGVRERVDGSSPEGGSEVLQKNIFVPVIPNEEKVGSTLVSVPPENSPEVDEDIPEATSFPSQERVLFLENRLSLEEAKADRLRAEIALLEKEISNRILLAPWEGLVQEVSVSEGEQIEEGALLVEISQVDPVEFRFRVSKKEVSFLRMGMEVEGRVANTEGREFKGKISFIGPELNEDQSVEVRAEVENANRALRSGMEARARIKE